MADKNVQMPDGTVVAFPGDMSDDAISEVLRAQQPAADTRNAFQRNVDGLQHYVENPQERGGTQGPVSRFAGGMVGSTLGALAHPYDAANGIIHAVTPDKGAAGIGETLLGPAGPMAVHTAQSLYRQPAATLGNMVGGIAMGEAGGAALGAAKAGLSGTADLLARPVPQSIPATDLQARGLARALVVPAKQMDNFIGAAKDEMGTVIAHAEQSGIPINSKLDFAKAAQSAADTVQGHYDTQILEPNAQQTVTAPPGSGVRTIGEGRQTTIGAINDRLDSIRQTLANKERDQSVKGQSDQELQVEARTLANTLHTGLARYTGLTPEDIAALRQQAGKLRTIADAATDSANADTQAAGRQAMGQGSVPMNKFGVVESLIQKARGGPEVIGNKQLLQAIKDIQSTPMRPLPQPSAALYRYMTESAP